VVLFRLLGERIRVLQVPGTSMEVAGLVSRHLEHPGCIDGLSQPHFPKRNPYLLKKIRQIRPGNRTLVCDTGGNGGKV